MNVTHRQPRTVLLVTVFPFPKGGGLMTHMMALEDGLKALGYQVKIISASSIPRTVLRLMVNLPSKAMGYLNRDLAFVLNSLLSALLVSLVCMVHIIRAKPTVVNLQSVFTYPYMRAICRLFRVKLVVTVHGYARFEALSMRHVHAGSRGEAYLSWLERCTYSSRIPIVTVDTRIRNHVLSINPSANVTVIHNFIRSDAWLVEDETASQVVAAKFGLQVEGKRVILCPRRLVEKNGVLYAIRAMTQLVKRTPNAILVCAGAGPEWKRLSAQVAELGLQNNVVFLGHVRHQDMPWLYAVAEVVVIPSINSREVEEATSISAIEAMCSGRPVVATRVGGLLELIADGINGLMVPEKDADSLASAVLTLLENPALRHQLGEAAREYALEHHSHVSAAKRFVDLYERQ